MRSTALPISHTTTRLEAVTLLRLGRILNFMKRLLDRGERLPDPSLFDHMLVGEAGDRFEIGKNLLAAFLYDGRVWGMTPGGEAYTHSISRDFTEKFLKGIRRFQVRG